MEILWWWSRVLHRCELDFDKTVTGDFGSPSLYSWKQTAKKHLKQPCMNYWLICKNNLRTKRRKKGRIIHVAFLWETTVRTHSSFTGNPWLENSGTTMWWGVAVVWTSGDVWLMNEVNGINLTYCYWFIERFLVLNFIISLYSTRCLGKPCNEENVLFIIPSVFCGYEGGSKVFFVDVEHVLWLTDNSTR